MQYTANVECVKVSMSPYGFIHFSSDYLHSAKLFRDNLPHQGYSPVPYDAYCLAIELALKGYLLAMDVSRGVLAKEYRHNLHSLINCAEENGLHILSGEEKMHIQKARKMFRPGIDAKYPSFVYCDYRHIAYNIGAKGALDLPDIDQLHAIAEKLIRHLGPICLAAS